MSKNSIVSEIAIRTSDLRKRGAFDDALTIVLEGLRTCPNDCCLLMSLGVLQLETTHIDDAILTFRRVIQLMPNNAAAHYNLGCALSSQGIFPESIAEFQSAVSIDPNGSDIHERLGNDLVAIHSFPEAITEYETALQLSPTHVGLYLSKALVLYDIAELDQTIGSQQKWASAREAFLTAIQASPTSSEAYYGLGVCEFRLKHFAASTVAFKNATAISPEKEHFYLALGRSQFRSLQWQAAWNTAKTYCKIKTKTSTGM